MNSFDFEKAWNEVTDFENKGLPESALKIVNEIAQQAQAQNNVGQQVKAMIHQLKLADVKEENAFVKNMIRLKGEADHASYPMKPLLHSMLGELYWQYYQSNRYEFINRSATINVEENDIETWNLPKIIQETFTQYKLSLEEADKSKKEVVDIYEPVIYKGNDLGRKYRPTLYDFLAHRAVDFFMSEEPHITKPVYAFTLDKKEYISEAAAFVQVKVTSPDTLSMKFYALTILQDLIQFHLQDADPGALVDVDLKRLKFVRMHLTQPDKDDLYMQALERLEQKVKNNPLAGIVLIEKARVLVEHGALYKPLLGDNHKWDLKKAYALCEEEKKRFPDSDGAIRCENLQEDILSKSINATIEEHNVPGQPFRSLVHYKNFTDLYYRIIKVTRDEVQSLRKKLEKDYSNHEENFIEHFTAKPPFKTGKYTLPDDGDYQQHSIEVKLDALPEGEYMVLYSHHSNFSTKDNGLAYAFTVVSNIGYVHRALPDGSAEIYTLHRQSGEPLAAVTTTLFSQRYNYKKNTYERIKVGSFVTDANGYLKVGYLKSEDQRSFSVDFRTGNDFNSTDPIDRGQNYYYYSGAIDQYKSGKEPAETQTFFFLDRAIYRPGQTIYFKGLVISSDGKNPLIMKGYTTTVRFLDVNGQEQGTKMVTTNEYGTFNGVFTAPSGGLTGNMQIRNDDGSGDVYFSVEEYKRPKFEVAFNPVTASFRLNDVIQAEGYARAYSGANIDGALVKYRVVRAANFPMWWWARWGNFPTSPEVEIVNGNSTSDSNGKFTISFTAVPDLSIERSSDPTFTYKVYADVTDINGETHSSSTAIAVGYKSLRINATIDNVNKDDRELKKEFNIQTSNLAGEFQAAKGQLKIYLLKAPAKTFRPRLWEQPDRQLLSREEYYTLFPKDQYEDEVNKYKWAKDKEVYTMTFDTGKNKTFTIPNLSQWKEGEYILEITSADKDGEAVREVSYFTVYAPTSKSISTPAVMYYQPVKMKVEPGEKASFTTGTSEDKINVLYEVEQEGVLLSKEWITLKNEQRLFEIPIKEEYRGNIAIHYTFIKDNRLYIEQFDVTVPYTNKQLDISFASFRDKLQPGEQEQWKIIVKGKAADKVAAEMVATLYDASLDEFRANSWYAQFYHNKNASLGWTSASGFDHVDLTPYTREWNHGHTRSAQDASFDHLNWFDYSFYQFRSRFYLYEEAMPMAAGAPRKEAKKSSIASMDEVEGELAADTTASDGYGYNGYNNKASKPDVNTKPIEKVDLSDVKVRTNFNETAFFFPQLMTNEHGEIIIKFTIPEALTRWKMLGFAHTKDLKSGFVQNQLVTQKDIMVVPNQPRFFRENDIMKFSAKISSLVDKELTGIAQLEFFDALTMKPIDDLIRNQVKSKNFALKSRQSTSLEWSIEIPEGLQAITYRIVAKAGDFSDGEEMVLPVVTNRMLVTETLPLPIRGKQTKEFKFEKLLNNKSTTLRHQRYTLEFTSNPAWYAIQALPYLMEYPYDCVEQTFSKYYANSIAAHVANSNPRIKQVFDTWKNIQPDALLSNLEKNQELKSALLEETPWVLQAKDESQRKRMVGALFDLNRMANEQERALEKITKAQSGDGGFSWFPGFPSDIYMTQHIIAGMGHLDVMGVKSIRTEGKTWSMITRAIEYIDANMKRDYDRLKEQAKRKEINLDDNQIGYLQYHYLYTRSYFKDRAIPANSKEAFDYFLGQAKKYWLKNTLYLQGMTCLALKRFGDNTTPAAMIKSFSERALHSEEMGMYWKNDHGYYWYQAPIETQALMIEVYDEVAADTKSVEDMKAWLLKQKQTQDWKTTKATTEACYALLRRGTNALASSKLVDIYVGDEIIDPAKRADTKTEVGTGYFKTAWQANEITADMGKIKISKSDEGVAWGAAYWQYFEQLDKITPADTPLKLKKDLYLQQNTDRGPVITPVTDKTELHVGDLVKVKIELRVDRTMEYIHLKDMRASGFEPVSTISTHKYQDGLYYYESPRDLATNFFIGYLPKGTYIFEYALRVSQKGNFSNGVTTIQCMYAPEFTSHSQGIRVQVK
ncbi:Alpha-2-macroglobulin family N-terminal region [Ohtaekwangia koreensis]|uniref:Alpha-2-macroglobulin family N-terminal region n=2 Tax=Ohtaekwangia koreensis TaxID=688867 RepID=A0A1T5M7A8_9BACT|nr:Alpha-2-macroglobulin family N-terminal region [Ohtaekwangia koreensis]